MSKDSLPGKVCSIDFCRDQLWQFFDDVGVHPVALRPGLLRRIDVKPCSLAEIALVRGIRDVLPARARIRADHDDPEFGRPGLKSRFGRDVLPIAGETGQVGQDRDGPRFRLRWGIDRDFHAAAQLAAVMTIDGLTAAEARPL